MSKKSAAVAAMVEKFRGSDMDARYLGYFDCFNRELFFEAHDVLEDLWLEDKNGVDGNFYKALIQLAGAFVHLQKHRLRPASALFQLADKNLRPYAPVNHRLRVDEVLNFIQHWNGELQSGSFEANPLRLRKLSAKLKLPEVTLM